MRLRVMCGPLNAEVDVAFVERLAVGGAVAEDLQQAHQQRQFVDVGFADVDVALAGEASERRAFAAEDARCRRFYR